MAVKKLWPASRPPEYYLERSGGRRACPHPTHRMGEVDNSPASVIMPECAGPEAWLKARREGIGGSEVGALVGISEYETPFSIWNIKRHGGKDLSGEAAIEWGHRLEEAVALKAADELGLVSRFAGGLWARRDNPVLRVTPDRFACKARSWKALGVIECKTAGEDEHWESGTVSSQGTGSAPLSYRAQLQWQMGILGLPVGWLACFHLSFERKFFLVEEKFNADWFAELAAEATRFWRDNVEADEPPMQNLRHPKTEELLKELYPSVTRPATDLPEDAAEWLADYQQAKERFEAAEADLNSIKNYFRMMTGDAGAGYIGEHKAVSYPEVTSSRINVTALREKFPEVAEAVTEKSSYRRMTIRPIKSKKGVKE